MDQNRERANTCQRLLLSLGIAAALSATTLQAADTIAYTVSSTNQFGTVDLNTGVFTKIITAGFNSNGFGVSGGALYGMSGNGYVFQFNFSTGVLTLAPNYALSNNLQGFGSTSAGLYIVDGYGDLSSVNPSTGSPTLIGPTGVAGLGGGVLSTSADSTTLYWVNNIGGNEKLYQLNTSTGAATPVGATGNGAGSGIVQAMLFEGGTLWASLGYNTGPTIGTLNTSTGAETFVVNQPPGDIFALAPYPLSPVPGPSILAGGVVPVDSPSNTIQPGEWISIYGNNLAASTVTWTGNFPQSLGNTSVTINGRPAYLSFVSPTQVNVQAPDDTTTGIVPVVVTSAIGKATSTVTLAQFAPAFLLLDTKHVAGIIVRTDGSGAYGGGSYDIVGPTGKSLGYPTVAAKAGDSVVLFGVGFGPTSPVVLAGQAFSGAAPTTKAVNVLINNVSVTPAFAGLSGAGLYQLNLILPAGLGTGDVTLAAAVNAVQTQSSVVISLQ
jgi:uncharacterized protein (TIGR03437 family)